ncbi:hypothetical protein [Afipia massiliensis]|uniref:hypothetical protein n=1 Tax=Afipia massiliensis TaxID=211460 RepID=UPI001618DC4F|nr:hypothetical protein [Afipia massiliensis]
MAKSIQVAVLKVPVSYAQAVATMADLKHDVATSGRHSVKRLACACVSSPRIHGELLKLGIEIGQTSVAKYMAKRRDPPSQGWKTFLHNQTDGIAAMDLFVVPTISFRLLYGLLIMRHGRRQILWFGVTAHPTAEWIANQFTEACGWRRLHPKTSIDGHSRSTNVAALPLAKWIC